MKNEPTASPDEARIDDDAASWAARRLSGNFSDADAAALDAWLAADERHAEAYKDYMAIAEAGAAAGFAAPRPLAAPCPLAANDAPEPPTARRRMRARRWMIAAPALAAGIAAAVFIVAAPPETAPAPVQYAAEKGAVQTIALADGSVVTLNTDSILTVEFEKTARRARLDKGEAFFEVAPDAARPFSVNAGEATATALGTAFSVRKDAKGAAVFVHEGLVAVAPAASNAASPLRLHAGETVAVDKAGEAGAVAAFDTETAASWRRGFLVFENAPLAKVIAELNRYYGPQIEIADPALAGIPVSGRFNIDDQEVAVRALAVALSLKADWRGPARIVLETDG